MNIIPLYIAAIALLMLASAVWCYRQRDMSYAGERPAGRASSLFW
ncbi:hypothetical protein X750_29335 [Mesorhizobium sp. LNJC394B00]|nr:hypothetical protein X750_29335 [Mesorhizobium sp. LNJC394B00]